MGAISKRYAKAAYQYALEKGESEILFKEMKTLVLSFQSFRDLQRVLTNPTLSVSDKQKVLLTASGVEVSASCRRVLQLLSTNKRESFAYQIALMYIELFKQEHGIVECRLTTTQPASDKMKESIVEVLKNIEKKSVDFVNHINPDIIGGFVLRVNDMQLDASVKTQLHRLRLQLAE